MVALFENLAPQNSEPGGRTLFSPRCVASWEANPNKVSNGAAQHRVFCASATGFPIWHESRGKVFTNGKTQRTEATIFS